MGPRRDIPGEQDRHPMRAHKILQLPRLAAISLQDALIQDHQQLLKVHKRQQKTTQLEDEASVHGGEHQRGVQGMRSGGVGALETWEDLPRSQLSSKAGLIRERGVGGGSWG